jgi:hypothetical protein
MGVFNFFVFIPQIVNELLLGSLAQHFFNGHIVKKNIMLGEIYMAFAGFLTYFVKDEVVLLQKK